jgi:mevalonate kinase
MQRSNTFSMTSSINARANGKLLISGEYLVLAGAKALALPVRFGQASEITENHDRVIRWISRQPDGVWFTCELDPADLRVRITNDPVTASVLSNLFQAARRLNGSFPEPETGFVVNVSANYPLAWGLGSSSTLISLVANWARVDPFALFRQVSEGSGYDIACAVRSGTIFYQWDGAQPLIWDAQPGEALRRYAYFVSLGNKQDSKKEVASFLNNCKYSSHDIETVSDLSSGICLARTADELCRCVIEHERILGGILGKKSIAGRFRSFPGTVKSLGAWGGDFGMFISGLEKKSVIKLLNEYGFQHIFTFDEIKATS